MAHIHTNPGEHDHTASAFIVRTDTDQPKLLLHIHKKLGVLLQPGGHIELMENPWQAIRHEIIEETGYELEQLKLLQPELRLSSLPDVILHPYPVAHNTQNFDTEGLHKHTDISYAFVAQDEPVHQPDIGESTILRWVSLEELRSLDEAEIFGNVRKIGEFVLTDILSNWQVVELSEFDNN